MPQRIKNQQHEGRNTIISQIQGKSQDNFCYTFACPSFEAIVNNLNFSRKQPFATLFSINLGPLVTTVNHSCLRKCHKKIHNGKTPTKKRRCFGGTINCLPFFLRVFQGWTNPRKDPKGFSPQFSTQRRTKRTNNSPHLRNSYSQAPSRVAVCAQSMGSFTRAPSWAVAGDGSCNKNQVDKWAKKRTLSLVV